MPITPIPQPAAAVAANPYPGYLGVAPSYGLPALPTAAPGVGHPLMPILNSSATSTAVPGFPFGTAPSVFPGAPATSYYYSPAPHPLSYAAPMPTHPLGMPVSAAAPHSFAPFSYPYLASGGYAPTAPFAPPTAWPYGLPPPVATTAGPFAGATVQTHTSVPTESNSIVSSNKGDASSKDSTSPVDAKSAALGSGSDTTSGTNIHRQHAAAPHTTDNSQSASFNITSSNRAITENRQLIVKFLTDDTSEQQFRDLFERFGPVENARIIYDKKTNHTKGFGFITYRHAEHAVQALRNMGGYQLHGRQLNVALAQTERKRAFSPTELTVHPPQTVTVSTST